jgi:hypothetical protein
VAGDAFEGLEGPGGRGRGRTVLRAAGGTEAAAAVARAFEAAGVLG